jgi:hypothetical protein
MIVLSEQSRQAVEDNDVDISPPQYSPSGRLVMIVQARCGLGCDTSDRLDAYRRSVRLGDHGCCLTRFLREVSAFCRLRCCCVSNIRAMSVIFPLRESSQHNELLLSRQ